MASADNKTTFWQFLSDKKITIPIIQRDYAQGRDDKSYIREGFLKDLRNALDNETEIKLDYVYGAESDNAFLPLDGQQRLTTLWLIHWFIAYKEGKIEVVGSNESHELILNQVGKTLKKFSYETRDSSRDFCQKIIEYAAREKYSDSQNHFKEKIQSNIWFYKSWQHDPTIKAMLTMIQAIENRFKDSEKKYWDLLSGPYCPIVFFEIDLIENNLSDDLYIKMNARGKALSSFENFKADFIGFLQLKDREGKIDHYLFEPNNGIPIKMDTAWTDIFWENRSNNCDIDEIYFAFFNRFFFNEYLVSVNNSQGLESSELYKYFYGVSNSGSDDTLIAYKSFDYYKQILEPNPNMVKTLFNTLNNIKAFHNLNKLLVSEGIPELFSFIPRYLTDNDGKNVECYDFAARKIKKTSGIEQRLRPIFYAICKFFEFQDCTDEISEGIAFHRWIRVCKNLIADPRLRNVDALRSILLTIKELSPFSHAIYEHLSSLDFSNTESPSILESQLIEECEKASHILLNPDSETLIEEIEQMAFFNGQIRFVYRDESWNIDWEDVPRKIQTIQNVFSDKGVRDVSFIAKFVSLFTKIYQLNETFKISLRASAWMETLLNPQYCDVIHNILLCNDMNTEEGFKSQLDFGDIEISDERKRMIIKAQHEICSSVFLGFLCEDENDNDKNHPRIHCWGIQSFVGIYQNNTKARWKIYLIGNNRNTILSALFESKIPNGTGLLVPGKIYSNQKVENLDLFRERTVEFIYCTKSTRKGYRLRWNQENNILSVDEEGQEELLFSADGIADDDLFVEKLEEALS